MADYRVTVELDYVVPDGTDPDEFHDVLRERIDKDGQVHFVNAPYGFQGVWTLEVRDLKDN